MSGVEARATMEAAVRRELYGPLPDERPRGQPIDCAAGVLHFGTPEESRGEFHDALTGEEILVSSDPLRRYGIGILHGGGTSIARNSEEVDSATDVDLTWVPGLAESEGLPSPEAAIGIEGRLRHDVADSDDFDLTDANQFKPSALAVSFRATTESNSSIHVRVTGAYYDRLKVHIGGLNKERIWWVRRPFDLNGDIEVSALPGRGLANLSLRDSVGVRVLPSVRVYTRPLPHSSDLNERLLTVVVVNQSSNTGPSSSLFQVGLEASGEKGFRIEPYPEPESNHLDQERESLELLYRKKRTFAIGHGCAADWGKEADDSVPWVGAAVLPAFEVPSLTPDVYVESADGRRPVSVSMAELAQDSNLGREQVEEVLSLYANWIDRQRSEISMLDERHQNAATRHMDHCESALNRMREGWALVLGDPIANRAFVLANQAMLGQQVRSRLDLREVEIGKDDLVAIGPHPQPVPEPGTGNWRAFQIAFVLATLPELLVSSSRRRETVDLIFFPTGGGKTEAYLGAAAISLLARRLRDPSDVGTDTLMRYTLRLLTTQQFLRAASLICVLEDIRSKNEAELGDASFGIGIWLGGSSTPNTWEQAKRALNDLKSDRFAQNKFLLLRCPWCGAQMGPKPKGAGRAQHVIGYERSGKKVALRCPDKQCRYGGRQTLPVHVVDADIYEARPSLVVGTVDKFAMLAWRPQARSLFSIGSDGTREFSPPSLIIQDELHLISGPLGSMVGLYEPMIEDLATDRRGDVPVRPKVVASTATVRRYEDQILGIFGRGEVALFPPHGLEEGHSFFAEPAVDVDGVPEPGRKYVGIMSASLGSTQTVQVRVASAALLGAAQIPEEYRDGYWTNLNFLNSLRELGNTVSLLDSDIPDYLTGLKRRDGIEPRWPRRVMELTSRRRNDEIPMAIEQLQTSYGSDGCVDICLASNIIEVGVDIDRLALMTIVGQPKTTAQYIQVSGRVGRRPDKSPGLVLTIYGAARPRDRSHYERFRTYHQSLYAQVEPTSVTPFARPVLRRALHGAVVSHIRQSGPSAEPNPFPESEFMDAIELLRARARAVDIDETAALESEARARADEWRRWERTQWSANVFDGDPRQGLMRFAGSLPALESRSKIWDIPTSMRNVDAECRLQISLAYLDDIVEEEGVAE